jgi:hypothetical protein
MCTYWTSRHPETSSIDIWGSTLYALLCALLCAPLCAPSLPPTPRRLARFLCADTLSVF